MRGLFIKDIDHRPGQKKTLLALIMFAVGILFLYFTYIHFTARALCEDVYISWSRLETSLESKAEASALLAGYLAQSSAVSRGTFERILGLWEDVILAEDQKDKMDAGKRANNESYGIIAMAHSGAGSLNGRAKRTLERLDSLELQLARDIKYYNDSLLLLLSQGERLYMGDMLVSFSGCMRFGLFTAEGEGRD